MDLIRVGAAVAAVAVLGGGSVVHAQAVGSTEGPGDAPTFAPGDVAFHAQSTFVVQAHDDFRSPYRGPNSLSPAASARETWDVTGYIGWRPWRGGEVWLEPEVDQGFGLSDTLGVAGFPSGEAYKVGSASPYVRLQRAFVRQTFALPGPSEDGEGGSDQFAGPRSANRVVITAGKFSVGDVFDTNHYAHDPRGDFLNWSVIDAGTFDYAADAWGYSAGAAADWRQGRWSVRAGAFLLSDVPNSPRIDIRFKQFQLVGEVEERHTLGGRPGALKVTGFLSRGRMARLDDATAVALATGLPADPASVRRYASRPGVSVGLEQQVATDLGVFARAGWADGRYEAYEFTDIDRTASGGASLSGRAWGRRGDTVGAAVVVNAASHARERFLDAGGLGILIGDGRLPHPGTERIGEVYYDAGLGEAVHVTLDYQRIANPAYNRDRGPADVLALRLHGQF